MKYMLLTAISVLVISTGAFAQDDIEKALSAAPARLRKDATVIRWKPDHTYEILKKGTSDVVCYDRSGFPLQQPFSIECTSIANLDRAAQNLKLEAAGGDRAKTNALLDAAEKDGTRAKPEFGSVWYHLAGADQASARPHMTIAVPGATTASLGLPDNPRQGGVWIMNAGTSTAHLMTPGE